MEHPINKSTDATENDPSLSVTALIVVLALIFTFYFTVRHALAEVPSASEQAAYVLSMLP